MSKRRPTAMPERKPQSDVERIAAGQKAAASIQNVDVGTLVRWFDAEVLPLARDLGVIAADEGLVELCAWRDGPDAPIDSPERDWTERGRYYLATSAYMLRDAALPQQDRNLFRTDVIDGDPKTLLMIQMTSARAYLMGARDRGSSGTVEANKRTKEAGEAKRKEIRDVAMQYARAGQTKSFAARRMWNMEVFPGMAQSSIANLLTQEFPGTEWQAMKSKVADTGPCEK